MQRRTLLRVAVAGGALPLAAAAASFRDVLDTPASPSPLAARSLLTGLAHAGSRIVAVGQRGHVLFSDDASKSWSQAGVPVSSDLVAVHFATAERGWAVGHDGVILASNDAGKTWTRQLDGRQLGPQGTESPLLDVWFDDANHGHAVGAFGLLLRTADGGTSWQPLQQLADNPKSLHLYAVRRVGGELYIAGEQGTLLKWDGSRFVALASPYAGTLFGLIGNDRAVLAHGLRGNVVRSTDGGRSWASVTTGVGVGLTASTVDGRGRLLIASQAGHVMASHDDGASFVPLKIERPAPVAAIVGTAAGTLVLAGPRGVQALPLA